MQRVYTHSFKTDVGEIRTAATERGVVLLGLPGMSKQSFADQLRKIVGDCETLSGGTINGQAEKEIRSYLDGRLNTFTVPVDLRGTPFQVKVLKQVARIPYGRTLTYSEIASKIGNAKASRAVGSANARNNLPLLVPCHRVVASKGLGGYGGGLPLKKRLLQMEGALQAPGS